MTLTVYSFLMSIVWFGLFSVLLLVLRRKEVFVLSFGLLPMLCLVIATLLRVFLPLEFPFTKVIGSTEWMPNVVDALQTPAVWIGGQYFSLSQILTAVWVCGAVAVTVWRLGRAVRSQRLVSKYLPDFAAQDAARKITGQDIDVRKGYFGGSPYVCGTIRPVVVLPYGKRYSDIHLKFIILHEWQHFVNRDEWCKRLVEILCCVFWWNPLVYLLQNLVVDILEERCDFGVMSRLDPDERQEYLEMLLHEKPREGKRENKMPAASSTFAKSRSERAFIKRLRLGAHFEELESHKKAGGIIVSILIGILFVFSYTMVIQPYIDSPDESGGYTVYNGSSFEDSYLIDVGDGTYLVYIDGQYGTVKDISIEPFASMPIIQK